MASQEPGSAHSVGRRHFATTQWSVVLAAGEAAGQESRDALCRLCETYWYPLYAFVRREGHDADQARDLTQSFFARLLEKNIVHTADRERGKFRSFLLVSLKHFLANEWRFAKAEKRGGGKTTIPWGFDSAEVRYQRDPADELTPAMIFERRWALTVLEQAMSHLRAEYAGKGKSELFSHLKDSLGGQPNDSYRQLAEKLQITEASIKVAVHRLRRRYRALLQEEIAHTLQDGEDVQEEIRYLFQVLGRN